jgi:hypothetical protein
MGRLRMGAVFAALVIFASSIAPVWGQEVTGAVVGIIRDSSGSVVPGASITLSNQATQAQLQTTSDESGNYQFPLVRAGRYTVTAEASGFQRLVRPDVIVNTAERLRLDLGLQVGAVTETVTVTAETPLLQSEKATVGQVVEQRTLVSIPLATRNFTHLLGTSAGVVGQIFNADNPGTGSDSVSVNGQRRGSNAIMVDGFSTSNQLNNAPDGDGTPSIEFLSELKVLTSLYTAENGRNAGSIINVTTRAGTNDFHGTVYEYLRNTRLNARPFFLPERGVSRQNQFGGNFGGRIFRDRTFFFGGWESSRQANANSAASSQSGTGGAVTITVVPTTLQRTGNFGSQTIRDPLTGQPFLNNTIPASRINAISRNIQDQFIPQPNFSQGAFNFIASSAVTTSLDQYTTRIDHRFNDKNTLFGRWFDSYQEDRLPFGQGLPGFSRSSNRKKRSLGFTDTHIFSPGLVLETRFGWDYVDQFISFGNAADIAALGMRPISGVTLVKGLPRVNINNYANGGFGNQSDWHDLINTYTSGGTMTWVRGRHTIKFGGDNRLSYLTPQNNQSARGVWTYQGSATGDPYADFLLSIPRTKTFGSGPGELKFKASYWGLFLTDNFKLTPNVTVDVGLRYEAAFHPGAFNLPMVNFWPERYQGPGSLESSGLVQGGINGIPKSTIRGDWNNFMPRLGIAWRVTDKWVVRTGAGLYYDERTGQIAQGLFSNPPVFTQRTVDCAIATEPCSLTQPDNWTFVDPGHDPTRIPFPTTPTQQLQYSSVNPNTLTDNAWQWNFTVQRQLPSNTIVEAGYLGTKGTHLLANRNINPLIPLGGNQFTRLYPGFANINMNGMNDANSTYHALQLTLRRRVASSTFQLSYTASKTLTSGDENARFQTSQFFAPWNDWSRAKGPANFDRPQRLAFTLTHDLPNKFSSGLGRHMFNNWSVNSYIIIQSGTPLTVFNRDSGAGLGGTTRDVTGNFNANVISGVPLIHPTGSTKENLTSYVNKAAWAPAPAGTYGNSGRGMFRGPGQWNADMSVFKDFRISERFGLQWRTEFFNILNHANFALGTDTNTRLSLDSPSFGQITGTSVNARLIQFALRLSF